MQIGWSFAAMALMAVHPALATQRDPVLPVPLLPVVDDFFRTCEQKTASGLGYSVLRPGQGRHPGEGDVVLLDYIVYSAYSGEVFDQSTEKAFPVAGVIPGVAEGVQLVGAGGIVRLCIPAAQAYGAKGAGPIPPETDLVFQAELRSVMTRQEFEAKAARKGR